MNKTDLPEDSQFIRVDLGAAIVPVDEYFSDEEEDDEIPYMEHQAEIENAKPQPDGVDAPPTALLDAEHTGERHVPFNIGEEIKYTKDGHNEKGHILTGTSYIEGMKYNLLIESGEEIVTHTTHMARLDDPDIASIPTNPQHFKEEIQYLSKEYAEHLARPTKLTALQQKFLTWYERLNHLYFS